MRVLVTGGAGFIGSHLVDALVARGDTVTVLDDLSTGRRQNLAAVAEDIRFVEGSVTDYPTVCAAAEGAELIYHEAAVASVPRSIEDPRHSHATNVGGTVNVLEAARRLGARRVVFACSAAIYGNRDGAVHEDDVPNPESPYAVEKLASEHYLRVWPALYGVETVSLRYFNVFGPRQDPSSPYSGVVSIFAERMRAGQGITIFGDGEQTRDFVAVADVVRANLLAGTVPDARGVVANIGRGASTSLNSLYRTLADLYGAGEPAYGPARAGDIRHSLANVDRARALLGFEAQTSVADGLALLVKSLR